MKMRNMIAVLAAMAVSAVGISALPAFAAAETYPDSITVMVGGTWGSYAGSWTEATADNSVTITDNGTYTIHVPSGEAGDLTEGSWAMAIRTTNFNAFDYGDEGDDFYTALQKGGVTMTVDSVKINGVEKKTGDSVLRDDDNGNDMRINIYNQWTSPKVAIVDGNQVFDGDVDITFTVAGLKFGAQTAEETTTVAETTTAAAETTTTAAGTTTTAAGTTTAATTTTGSGNASTTAAATTAAASTTNTSTGDNSGIAVAVAALAVAGGAALVSRKRK